MPLHEMLAQVAAPLAYLDPGSGSLMLQILIAGLFSGLFFLRSSFDSVVGAFRRHVKVK